MLAPAVFARQWYSVFANREYRMVQPSLRPQDVVVLAKLLSYDGPRPSMAQMGNGLSISPSEVHAALNGWPSPNSSPVIRTATVRCWTLSRSS